MNSDIITDLKNGNFEGVGKYIEKYVSRNPDTRNTNKFVLSALSAFMESMKYIKVTDRNGPEIASFMVSCCGLQNLDKATGHRMIRNFSQVWSNLLQQKECLDDTIKLASYFINKFNNMKKINVDDEMLNVILERAYAYFWNSSLHVQEPRLVFALRLTSLKFQWLAKPGSDKVILEIFQSASWHLQTKMPGAMDDVNEMFSYFWKQLKILIWPLRTESDIEQVKPAFILCCNWIQTHLNNTDRECDKAAVHASLTDLRDVIIRKVSDDYLLFGRCCYKMLRMGHLEPTNLPTADVEKMVEFMKTQLFDESCKAILAAVMECFVTMLIQNCLCAPENSNNQIWASLTIEMEPVLAFYADFALENVFANCPKGSREWFKFVDSATVVLSLMLGVHEEYNIDFKKCKTSYERMFEDVLSCFSEATNIDSSKTLIGYAAYKMYRNGHVMNTREHKKASLYFLQVSRAYYLALSDSEMQLRKISSQLYYSYCARGKYREAAMSLTECFWDDNMEQTIEKFFVVKIKRPLNFSVVEFLEACQAASSINIDTEVVLKCALKYLRTRSLNPTSELFQEIIELSESCTFQSTPTCLVKVHLTLLMWSYSSSFNSWTSLEFCQQSIRKLSDLLEDEPANNNSSSYKFFLSLLNFLKYLMKRQIVIENMKSEIGKDGAISPCIGESEEDSEVFMSQTPKTNMAVQMELLAPLQEACKIWSELFVSTDDISYLLSLCEEFSMLEVLKAAREIFRLSKRDIEQAKCLSAHIKIAEAVKNADELVNASCEKAKLLAQHSFVDEAKCCISQVQEIIVKEDISPFALLNYDLADSVVLYYSNQFDEGLNSLNAVLAADMDVKTDKHLLCMLLIEANLLAYQYSMLSPQVFKSSESCNSREPSAKYIYDGYLLCSTQPRKLPRINSYAYLWRSASVTSLLLKTQFLWAEWLIYIGLPEQSLRILPASYHLAQELFLLNWMAKILILEAVASSQCDKTTQCQEKLRAVLLLMEDSGSSVIEPACNKNSPNKEISNESDDSDDDYHLTVPKTSKWANALHVIKGSPRSPSVPRKPLISLPRFYEHSQSCLCFLCGSNFLELQLKLQFADICCSNSLSQKDTDQFNATLRLAQKFQAKQEACLKEITLAFGYRSSKVSVTMHNPVKNTVFQMLVKMGSLLVDAKRYSEALKKFSEAKSYFVNDFEMLIRPNYYASLLHEMALLYMQQTSAKGRNPCWSWMISQEWIHNKQTKQQLAPKFLGDELILPNKADENVNIALAVSPIPEKKFFKTREQKFACAPTKTHGLSTPMHDYLKDLKSVTVDADDASLYNDYHFSKTESLTKVDLSSCSKRVEKCGAKTRDNSTSRRLPSVIVEMDDDLVPSSSLKQNSSYVGQKFLSIPSHSDKHTFEILSENEDLESEQFGKVNPSSSKSMSRKACSTSKKNRSTCAKSISEKQKTPGTSRRYRRIIFESETESDNPLSLFSSPEQQPSYSYKKSTSSEIDGNSDVENQNEQSMRLNYSSQQNRRGTSTVKKEKMGRSAKKVGSVASTSRKQKMPRTSHRSPLVEVKTAAVPSKVCFSIYSSPDQTAFPTTTETSSRRQVKCSSAVKLGMSTRAKTRNGGSVTGNKSTNSTNSLSVFQDGYNFDEVQYSPEVFRSKTSEIQAGQTAARSAKKLLVFDNEDDAGLDVELQRNSCVERQFSVGENPYPNNKELILHNPIRDSADLLKARKTLEKALKLIEHNPPSSLYMKLNLFLAALGVQEDTCTSDEKKLHLAYMLSESVGITWRQELISNICFLLSKHNTSKEVEAINKMSISTKRDQLLFNTPHCSGIQTMEKLLNCLPRGWRVVQLSALPAMTTSQKNSSKNILPDILICRYEKGETPITIYIRGSDIDSQFELGFYARFEKLLEDAASCQQNTDKVQYWKLRRQLDEDLRVLLDDLENVWLGYWKAIFVGSPATTSYQGKHDRVKLDAALKRLKAISDRLDVVPSNWPLVKLLLESEPYLRNDQLSKAVRDLWSVSPSNEAHCRLVKEIRNYGNGMKNRERNLEPVFLVLGKGLEMLPWESMPMFRNAEVPHMHALSRVPSLQLLVAQLAAYRVDDKCIFNRGLDVQKTSFVVDPASNLPTTSRYLRDLFSEQKGWEGVCGNAPDKDFLIKTLTNKDLYLFSGHGDGSSYMTNIKLFNLTCRPVCILMGCRSGKLCARGANLEPQGLPLKLWLYGCPCVVGNLWNVTDVEIDTFTIKLLENWLPTWNNSSSTENLLITNAMDIARKQVKLPYLTGAAPILYGIPLCCTKRLT